MSIPPSKRPPSGERTDSHDSSVAVPSTPPPSSSPSSASDVSATDSDPAGRLLHHLRDRGDREIAAGTRPVTPPASFAPGARVRVLRGTFMGKSGVVQELDGRGGARVQLGTLSARIDLTDLAAEADPAAPRERLTLSSSHRKPR